MAKVIVSDDHSSQLQLGPTKWVDNFYCRKNIANYGICFGNKPSYCKGKTENNNVLWSHLAAKNWVDRGYNRAYGEEDHRGLYWQPIPSIVCWLWLGTLVNSPQAFGPQGLTWMRETKPSYVRSPLHRLSLGECSSLPMRWANPWVPFWYQLLMYRSICFHHRYHQDPCHKIIPTKRDQDTDVLVSCWFMLVPAAAARSPCGRTTRKWPQPRPWKRRLRRSLMSQRPRMWIRALRQWLYGDDLVMFNGCDGLMAMIYGVLWCWKMSNDEYWQLMILNRLLTMVDGQYWV